MTHEDKQKLAEKIAEKAMSAKNVTYAVVLQAVYEALNARDEEIAKLYQKIKDSNAYTTYWGNRIKRLQSRLIKKGQEIKELKEKLLFADDSIKDADKWIAKYKLELDQLRNPWISVEKRMPPRDVALVFPTHSIPVIGMIGNSTDTIHTGMRYDYSSKEWCYGFTPMRKYGADNDLLISGDTLPVTHWMPIPKLKKGE